MGIYTPGYREPYRVPEGPMWLGAGADMIKAISEGINAYKQRKADEEGREQDEAFRRSQAETSAEQFKMGHALDVRDVELTGEKFAYTKTENAATRLQEQMDKALEAERYGDTRGDIERQFVLDERQVAAMEQRGGADEIDPNFLSMMEQAGQAQGAMSQANMMQKDPEELAGLEQMYNYNIAQIEAMIPNFSTEWEFKINELMEAPPEEQEGLFDTLLFSADSPELTMYLRGMVKPRLGAGVVEDDPAGRELRPWVGTMGRGIKWPFSKGAEAIGGALYLPEADPEEEALRRLLTGGGGAG